MSGLRVSRLRWLTIAAVFAAIVLGLVFRTASGTLCAFGYRSITAVCPLGSLETMLASRTLLPLPLISFAVILVIAVLLGRVFCGWVCPMPVMRRWLPAKSAGAPELLDDAALRRFHPQTPGRPSRIRIDSRHWVLAGAILSTAVFGFPVFCLVCPIGLTFGTVAVLWRLLHFNEPSWSLLVFPTMLAVELVVFRTWCRKICPLGALLSLLSSANVFARPVVDPESCLRTSKGMQCGACEAACFEGIDLHDAERSQPLSECTKCFDCVDACPVRAISLPFLPSRRNGGVAGGGKVEGAGRFVAGEVSGTMDAGSGTGRTAADVGVGTETAAADVTTAGEGTAVDVAAGRERSAGNAHKGGGEEPCSASTVS